MFYLAQIGSSLYVVQTGGTATALTLPSGVTIDATKRGRFGILDQQIVFVGASSISLWIDPTDLTVRPMFIRPPTNAPTLAAGSGTGLTGAYRCGVGYAVKNVAGIIVNRSPVTGPSVAVSITNKDLTYTNIPVSPESTVNCRILYRTAAGGSDLFELLQIDDNVTTSIVGDAMSDALLSDQIADPNIDIAAGAVPGTSMTMIREWKSRLWGVSGKYDERDDLRYTEVGQFYGWSSDNSLPAHPKGEDSFGITGLARRRDALGVLKRSRVLKVIGQDNSDFRVIILAEGPGCVSEESIVVIQDKAYWLGVDGVYRWDDSGVVNISQDSVDPWFTSDTYFSRPDFRNAFAGWNPVTNAYELSLVPAGGFFPTQWVAFHIDANGGKGEWLGPHAISYAYMTCRARLASDQGIYIPAFGASDGAVYTQNNSPLADIDTARVSHAISTRVDTKWHGGNAPDAMHYFGRLSILNQIESGPCTLTITPYLGNLNASAGTAMTADLTKDRQILGRIGTGRLAKLSFTQNAANQKFLLYGYEIKPLHEVGVR